MRSWLWQPRLWTKAGERTRPPGTFWARAAPTTVGPESLGRRQLRRRSLMLSPQKCPLCGSAAAQALSQPHGRRRPSSPSHHHLLFSSFRAISFPLPSSPVQTPPSDRFPFSEGTRGGRGAGASLSLSSVKGTALGNYRRDGDKRAPHSSSGKREDPRLQSRGRKLSWIKLPGPACCHLWLHFLLQA